MVAAAILMIGVSGLHHARHRAARYGLSPFAAPETESNSFVVLIGGALFPTELLRLLKSLRDLSKQPLHEVEHALPRMRKEVTDLNGAPRRQDAKTPRTQAEGGHGPQ